LNQYYWFSDHTKKATHTFTTYCEGNLEEAKKLVVDSFKNYLEKKPLAGIVLQMGR